MTTQTASATVLQEYADNRGVALRVDREKGIITGVKLLGAVSKKGREYPRTTMAKALPLYEGMRVNVDHVDPGQRRSLRDRIGLVQGVVLKEDGLYGDFHFNPKHPLAEQIAWDAENSPQNLGFSHDTRGVSRNVGGRVVVESIDKVLSVDLVANPATTAGLFEDDAITAAESSAGLSANMKVAVAATAVAIEAAQALAANPTLDACKACAAACEVCANECRECLTAYPESMDMEIKDLTLDQLKSERPDLATSLQESLEKGDELKAIQEELKTLKAEKATRELQEAIAGELKAAGLDPANKTHCSQVFLEDLTVTADAAKRKAKIDDRKLMVGNIKPAVSAAPSTGLPMQEAADGPAILAATAPLAERLRRFAKA